MKADDGKPLLVGDFVERKAHGTARAMLVFAADDPSDENPCDRFVRFATDRPVKAFGPRGEVKVERTGEDAYGIRLRSGACAFVVAK